MTPRTSPAAHASVAYLVSQYPKVSHAFIEREIRALRASGLSVRTFSVRPVPDSEVLTDADRAERAQTRVLLSQKRELFGALLALLATHPVTFVRALRQALHSGPGNARSRVWQCFYLAEAALLVLHMSEAGLRHLHVHFANNGADVARLVTTIGSGVEKRRWTWSLAVHGPTEFDDLVASDLAAKVRDADSVACISEYCRAQLAALVEPEHHAKLHIVRMAPELSRYPVVRRPDRSGPTRVLFVGRLVAEKGPGLLLNALAGAPGGAFEVRIVGDGPLRDRLAARIDELGLRDVVTLLGARGQDELPELYGWADVFCLPSFAEGLPVVLMEAMATGLPVVTTDIAGIPELVDDDVSGLIVTSGRADLLARALTRLREPALRARLGTRAADVVRARHDGGREAAALTALFAELTWRSSDRAHPRGATTMESGVEADA